MGKRLYLSKPEENSSAVQKPGSGSKRDPREGEVEYSFNLFSLVRLLFANRRLLIGATLCAGIVTAGVVLLIPNKYTATARLMPSSDSGGLSALAGMTGLNILDFAGGGVGEQTSSELFPAILTSARLKDIILTKNYTFDAGGESHSLTLQEYLEEEIIDKARIEYDRIIGISSEFKTGLISISVTTEYPEFSALIASTMIEELDLFNRTQRKSKATEYEAFARRQLDSAFLSLTLAENTLSEFQRNNRDWMSSSDPDLQQELLQRKLELEVQTKKYLLLTQQYELSRAEAQKDMPVVQALDTPKIPQIKSAPKRTVTVLFAMVAAALMAISFVYLREKLRSDVQSDETDSFAGLRDDFSHAYPVLSERIAKRASSGSFGVERQPQNKKLKSEDQLV